MSGKPVRLPARVRELDMGGLEQALGFRLRVLEQTVMRSFARHMDPLELSPTLYSILVLIAANPACRQIELAQALSMHQPNLVDRVALLMERRLVVRRGDAKDRRANVLALSTEGQRFMPRVRAAHEAHLAEIRELLGTARYAALLQLSDPTGL